MPALYLHPADPLWQFAGRNAMINDLREFGLIGPSTAETEAAEFVAGDRFMEHVMFLGCSPQLLPDPAQAKDGQQMCRIRLSCYRKVGFLCTTIRPAVRCGSCRTAAGLSDTDRYDAVYRCINCGKESLVSDLDWRRGAGFGRFFIEIRGVYPHEAVPADALLNRLGELSNCRWKYFYFQG